MKKILLSIVFLTVLHALKAQTKDKSDTANKLIINIDYHTGKITHTLQPKNTSKRIRPKVGSYITINVANLPPGFTASGEVEFENGNIEGAGVFNSFFKPEQTGTTAPDKSEDKNIDTAAEKKAIQEEIIVAAAVVDAESQAAIDNLFKESNSKTRININNLVKSLEIGDVNNLLKDKGIINDPLFLKPENKDKLAKAKIDYYNQQRLIKIAYDNLNRKLALKDSIILIALNKKDSLVTAKAESIVPKKDNLPIFDIQVPNSDIASIKVVIKKDKEKIVNQIPLSFYNKAGYKIDFSTGFFYTGLQDAEYKAVNKLSSTGPFTGIDSVYQIKQKQNGKGKIAIGLLAHYYTRWFKYFNLAASGGFSYQADNRIINFMLGTSALFGSQQRFILSFGTAFGKVKELDTNFFTTDKDYHKSIVNDKTELPITERLKTSLFFGVSYNLGTINNSKSVKRSF